MSGVFLLQRIFIEPNICHVQSCIRGLCYPVTFLIELLSFGMTHAEEDYEDLEEADILAVLLYATLGFHFRCLHTSNCLIA